MSFRLEMLNAVSDLTGGVSSRTDGTLLFLCDVLFRPGSSACTPARKDSPQEDETAASDCGTSTSNPSPRSTCERPRRDTKVRI